MKQYTRKQLKEYARLGLARDLTEVDPDTLPKWYEKIGVSRGIYTRSTERALYMAVGCDLLPEEMFSCIADTPKGLHAAALETVHFELEV